MSKPFVVFPLWDPTENDTPLQDVADHLNSISDVTEKIGLAIRAAIDMVLASRITGRYDIYGDDVSKVEKTYVGTRVELEVIDRLELSRGVKLDASIAGHEVDIKHTLFSTWMIPQEARDELCLLVKSNDREGTFAVGLLRCIEENLTRGANQDKKRSVNTTGMAAITWVVPPGSALPPNFLLSLNESDRTAIMSPSTGQARINELFRRCLEVPISRDVVEAVAQQKDSQKRVRAKGGARERLKSEGIAILSGTYHRDLAVAAGLPAIRDDEYISTRRVSPDSIK